MQQCERLPCEKACGEVCGRTLDANCYLRRRAQPWKITQSACLNFNIRIASSYSRSLGFEFCCKYSSMVEKYWVGFVAFFLNYHKKKWRKRRTLRVVDATVCRIRNFINFIKLGFDFNLICQRSILQRGRLLLTETMLVKLENEWL